MVWDLRAALLRKEEFESARLTDFEFRETVRAFKRLAAALGEDRHALLDEMADHGIETTLTAMAGRAGRELAEVEALYRQARADARRELIQERGDPSPVRLG